jgi:ribosomal-protein-alanine N-acetyltransferase
MSDVTSPFLVFPELKTERLMLRGLRAEDDQAMFAYKSLDEGQAFPRVEHHSDINQSRQLLAELLRLFYSRGGIYWGITLLPNDELIGTVGLRAMPADGHIRIRCEVACALSKKHRGKGIMTEAVVAVINFAFIYWKNLERIQAEIALENGPSLKLFGKLGFLREGVLRNYEEFFDREKNKNRNVDMCILGLLKDEWNQNDMFK